MWTRNRRTRAMAAVTACGLIAALAGCASADQSAGSGAESGELAKFVVALGAGDAVFGSFYLALQNGYYEDEGLDVEIVQTGSNTVNSVVSGQADVGGQGPGAAMLPVRDGKDMILVAKQSAVKGVIVGGPGVGAVSECQRMGTQTPGTSTFGWSVMYEEPFGASYELVNFPDYPTISASLASGSTDCITLNYTSAAPLLNEQTTLVGDPTAPNFPAELTEAMAGYVAGGIWGDRAHLEERRGAVESFLRAYHKADGEMATGDPAALAATLKQNEQYKSFEEAALVDGITHEQAAGTYNSDENAITEAGWNNTVEFLTLTLDFIDPDDRTWSFDQRIDMSFLQP